MATVNAYLHFAGNAAEVMNFYKTVFGTEFQSFQLFKDTPFAAQVSAAQQEKVMHATLPVGGDTLLMATDMIESEHQKHIAGNNFSLALSPKTEEEAYQLFNALAEGGAIAMQMEKTYWGALFGMVKDKSGMHWMINYTLPNQPQ
jgi:PhnB protein